MASTMTGRDIHLNKHADELFTDEVEMIATVLNKRYQFKIPAHMLNRNRSAPDITVVYDVTSKESSSNAKAWMGEIDKRVSDGVNKLPVENDCDLTYQKTLPTDEAKDFSKFEAKLVHVMDTFQTRFQSVVITRAQDLSHKLKVDESADLTESEPSIE